MSQETQLFHLCQIFQVGFVFLWIVLPALAEVTFSELRVEGEFTCQDTHR